MRMFDEFIGKKYGNLTITAFDSCKKNGTPVFAVTCDCGNDYLKTGLDRLESGKTKDCGCSKRNTDLTGKKFGRLLVIEKTDKRVRYHVVWKCKCECGNIFYAQGQYLKAGQIVSCGCISKEKQHFACKLPIHKCWDTMISRCYNPNKYQYYLYGGRGIRVCDEWNSRNGNIKAFSNFYDWAMANGYSDEKLSNGRAKYTLDRIDADGDYTPENCRWITNTEQQNNKRADKLFTYNGKTKMIKEWLKMFYVRCSDYYILLKKGYNNKFILDFISSLSAEELYNNFNTPKQTITTTILDKYINQY